MSTKIIERNEEFYSCWVPNITNPNSDVKHRLKANTLAALRQDLVSYLSMACKLNAYDIQDVMKNLAVKKFTIKRQFITDANMETVNNDDFPEITLDEITPTSEP